jgi:hypothetical protein
LLSATTKLNKTSGQNMTGFSETVDRQKLNNLMSVALGLSFAVAGLQDFILDSMAIEHQKILQNIPGGKCTKNCSRQYGRAFNRWCKYLSTKYFDCRDPQKASQSNYIIGLLH